MGDYSSDEIQWEETKESSHEVTEQQMREFQKTLKENQSIFKTLTMEQDSLLSEIESLKIELKESKANIEKVRKEYNEATDLLERIGEMLNRPSFTKPVIMSIEDKKSIEEISVVQKQDRTIEDYQKRLTDKKSKFIDRKKKANTEKKRLIEILQLKERENQDIVKKISVFQKFTQG